MSCVSSPTATEYTTITTSTTSTSFSQSVGSSQATVTTIVQESCVATGTLSGSATGCVSITQVNTIGGGSSTTQVPVVVTVLVTETQPTKTLYATCSDGSSQSQTMQSSTSQTTSTSTPPSLTTLLVESTPPPSVITQESSTTLSNGDVVATTIITTSTLPPSSVYVPSTLANPTATSSQSGSGTNVAPIVGGVIGGFVGLIVIVGALWYLCCRKRTSWDDIFERDDSHDEALDYPIAVRRGRDRNELDLGAEPKPYQYGLVGHVTPPPGSDSPGQPAAFHRPSFTTSMASSHSRNTSITPLLGAGSVPENATRPSKAGFMQAAAQPPSTASQSSTGPRSVSLVSTSSSTPLIDGSAAPSLSSRVDEFGSIDQLNRTGSPVPVDDRRVLQIINDAPLSPMASIAPASPTPTPTPTPSRPRKGGPKPRPSTGVVQHTDAGQVSASSGGSEPPPYSRV